MKKGKEKMGQLVARYGLLTALGLGSMSFVSGAPAAPAAPWDHGRNVKFEHVGQANGRAVEYALKDEAPATKTETVVVTKGLTKAEAGTLLQAWFKNTDNSQVASGLVDKVVTKVVAKLNAGQDVSDAKGVLAIVKDVIEKDAALKQKGQALIAKAENNLDSSTLDELMHFCLGLRGKASDDQNKKLSDLFIKQLDDNDLPKDVTETRSVGGGNVVFELKDANQAANVSAVAVFDAPNKPVVADFGAGNVDKINIMGEDAKTLFKNVPLDVAHFSQPANLAHLAVQDQPVAQANVGLASIAGGGNGIITNAITAMEDTVKKVAAVWYADEILDPAKGAIARIEHELLNGNDDNTVVATGVKLGAIGGTGIETKGTWAAGNAGGLAIERNDVTKILTVFKELFQQVQDRASGKTAGGGTFVSPAQIDTLLKAVLNNNADTHAAYTGENFVAKPNIGLPNLGVATGAVTGGVNGAGNAGYAGDEIFYAINNQGAGAPGLDGNTTVDAVKRLAELVLKAIPDATNLQPTSETQGLVHPDADLPGYYTSIYQLLDNANGGLLSVTAGCTAAVGAAGAAMDTYKARKLVEDMRFTSSFVDELGAHHLTNAPAIATYMPPQTATDLNSIEAEVNQRHGSGGLFEVKFPANVAAGDRFYAIFRPEFTNDANGDGANVFNNDGTPMRDAAHIVDLTNDYNNNSGTTPPNGNGVTALVSDHADAHVTLVLDASSGSYKDENGAKVRQALGRNVVLGDIVTGNPGNNGSTKVVLINRLTNSSRETDDLAKIEDKNRRAVIVKGAIKESATDSDWKAKNTKIDLVTAADGLNGNFWYDKFVNVRTLTLGAQAGTLLRDDTTGKVVYINEAMSGGESTFYQGLRAEQIIANNGRSSRVNVDSYMPFEVREVIAENKGTVIVYRLGVKELEPSSDKKHDFTAKDGAKVAIQKSDIDLKPHVEGDKSRIYQLRAKDNGSALSIAGTVIHLGQITTKVLNGVEIESSAPENLPGVAEIQPGGADAVVTLDCGTYSDFNTQLELDSNKGVNGVHVSGPGTVAILGGNGTSEEAIIKVTGIEKGNGLGYALISNEAAVRLVKGHLPIEGNVLVKSLSIGKDTGWEHLTGDMTVKELATIDGTLDEAGELHLKDLELKKGGILKGTEAKISVDGNLTDCKGKVDLSGGEITWEQDLALENNGEWKHVKVNAVFEGGVAAENSKVSFENADGSKVEFKKGLMLGSGSDWKLAGGEVTVGGGAFADNAKLALNNCKTSVAGDFNVQSKGLLKLDGGTFDVGGKFSVSDAEVLSKTTTTVKGVEILNNGKIRHDGGDYTIDGDAVFEGRFDASKNTQGKLKFVKDGFTATFKVTPVSDDGKQILLVMVSTASDDSVEGLEKAKEFRLLDQTYVEQFGSDQLLDVLADLAKKNTQIKLFDHVPDAITNDILAKTNVDGAVMPGYQAVKGSHAISLANVTNPDDIRLLTKMYNGELDLKGLPAGVIKALAAKWRKGTKNGGAVTFTANSDGTVSATGDVKAEALFNSTLDKIIGDEVKNAAKRIEAIGRSTAEENARGVIQLADSARHTAYNNLDKFLDPSAHYSVWASGFGDIARQKVCGYKVNYDIYGFEAGIDAALNNYWTLGLLGGYGKVNGKFKGEYKPEGSNNYLDKCDTKSYFGGVYGMWSDFVQDLEVKFSVLAGHAKFDEKRHLSNPFASDQHKSVDFGTKGFWISGNVDATYKHWDVVGIKLGPWASLSFTDVHQKEGATPFVGKGLIKVNDGHGQMNRVAEKYNRYAPELTVGVAADYDSPFGLLNLTMGYKRDFHKLSGGSVHLNTQILDAEGKVKDAYKADLGKNSNRSGRDSFVAQASYNMEYGPVGIALGIRGQVGDHFKDIAGSISASYSF